MRSLFGILNDIEHQGHEKYRYTMIENREPYYTVYDWLIEETVEATDNDNPLSPDVIFCDGIVMKPLK